LLAQAFLFGGFFFARVFQFVFGALFSRVFKPRVPKVFLRFSFVFIRLVFISYLFRFFCFFRFCVSRNIETKAEAKLNRNKRKNKSNACFA
jgi:hypothetical protein